MIRIMPVRPSEGVKFTYLHPDMAQMINLVATWSNRTGQEVWLRSFNDHTHGDNSLHYENLAIDWSTPKLVQLSLESEPNPVEVERARRVMDQLRDILLRDLGFGWDIVWRDTGHHWHLHIERDYRVRTP